MNPIDQIADLKTIGFRCSTNITSLITANPLDENGAIGTSYPARDSGFEQNAFLLDNHEDQPMSTNLFLGNEYYGTNPGINPFSYPPNVPDANGTINLGSYGYYPNLGDPAVRNRFDELGLEIFPREQQTADKLREMVEADAKKWWPIIEELRIKPE